MEINFQHRQVVHLYLVNESIFIFIFVILSICLGFEVKDWLIIIGGGFVTLLLLCLCGVAFIFTFKSLRRQRLQQDPRYRDGSLDSISSVISR